MTLFETLIHSSCFVDRLLPPFFFPLPKNDCDPAQSLPSTRPDRARCPGPAIRALAGQTTRDHLPVHRRFCPRSRSVQSPHGYDSNIRHRRSKRHRGWVGVPVPVLTRSFTETAFRTFLALDLGGTNLYVICGLFLVTRILTAL